MDELTKAQLIGVYQELAMLAFHFEERKLISECKRIGVTLTKIEEIFQRNNITVQHFKSEEEALEMLKRMR